MKISIDVEYEHTIIQTFSERVYFNISDEEYEQCNESELKILVDRWVNDQWFKGKISDGFIINEESSSCDDDLLGWKIVGKIKEPKYINPDQINMRI